MSCITACRPSGSGETQPDAAGSRRRCAAWPTRLQRCPDSGGHPHGAGCPGSSASPQCSSGPAPVAAGLLAWCAGLTEQVSGLKWLAFTGAAGHDFHDPAGADPGLTDVLWSLSGAQHPGDVAAVANLVIGCHKRGLALALDLAADLARCSVFWLPSRRRLPAPGAAENGRLVSSASAWISTTSRSSWPSSCRSTASPVA
jgi:hypothetical protein